MEFTKMHGLGNDFVLINRFQEEVSRPAQLAQEMCDRNFGIGADGLILVLPAQKPEADFRMRIFNPDGSEPEMCGNGIRCFAKYLYDQELTEKKQVNVETLAGIIKPELLFEAGKVNQVKVDMGEPALKRSQIPMKGPEQDQIVDETLTVKEQEVEISCVSMGNPHCVIFIEDAEAAPVRELGPKIETHDVFPENTNVEFIEVMNKEELKMRVWERGAGVTLACGTGACGSTVASILRGATNNQVTVHLLGGDLIIEWAANNHVYMTGPATEVFTGQWKL